jgi:hypothetical protein
MKAKRDMFGNRKAVRNKVFRDRNRNQLCAFLMQTALVYASSEIIKKITAQKIFEACLEVKK